TTRLLAAHGASVAIAGRSQEKAEALAGEVGGIGKRVDLADGASIDALVQAVSGELGGLDALVNLAGLDIEAPAETFADEDWHAMLDVNLGGAFRLSRAVAGPIIEARRGGRIVHFSSTRSVAGGRRGFAAYAAAKAGLNGLVRQLATEW